MNQQPKTKTFSACGRTFIATFYAEEDLIHPRLQKRRQGVKVNIVRSGKFFSTAKAYRRPGDKFNWTEACAVAFKRAVSAAVDARCIRQVSANTILQAFFARATPAVSAIFMKSGARKAVLRKRSTVVREKELISSTS